MKFMKNLLLSFFLTALFSSNASACKCRLASINEFVGNADEIYFATLQVAKVVQGIYPEKWPFIEGNFKIRKLLKGSLQEENVTLTTGLGGGDCGISMFVSATYVIFKNAKNNAIGACGGSSIIESFQEDEIEQKIKKILNAKSKK